MTIPDGVLRRGDKHWAIEVERSVKLTKELRKKLQTLCAEYDRVVYFGSSPVRSKLARIQERDEFSNLEVRSLPSEALEQSPPKFFRDDYKPSTKGREMLSAVTKEGIVSRAQLHRLMGWTPSETERVLEELKQNTCIRHGLKVNDDEGWVWCNHRGAIRSGTGLTHLRVPSRGELVRRIVLMEVQFDALARWPGSIWITRRLLQQGPLWKAGRHAACGCQTRPPSLCRNGPRILSQPVKTAALIKRWEKDYAGVLCYRGKKLASWVDGLIEEHGLDGVEARDIPKPPASLPYQYLEDEWLTGKEPFEPTDREMDLLRLVNLEGFVSELQLSRVLGIADEEEVEHLVDRLVEHKCLVRKSGWLRCSQRGTKISKIRVPPPPLSDQDRFLEQRFLKMELRLSYGEPASPDNWKPRRQIGIEKRAEGIMDKTSRHPEAAVLIDGEWHAVALVFRSFERMKYVDVLRRWSGEYPKVKCYCRKKDLEALQRVLKRHKLSSVEAIVFPMAPEGPARVRQEALYAALEKEEKEKDARNLPKELAQQELREAVKAGEVIKPDCCEHCGEKASGKGLHGHHTDYSRPKDVEWVCQKCHPARDQAGASVKPAPKEQRDKILGDRKHRRGPCKSTRAAKSQIGQLPSSNTASLLSARQPNS